MNFLKWNAKMAEFLGYFYSTKHLYEGWYMNLECNNRLCDKNSLQFNTSWDWLHKIIHKIETWQIIDRVGRFEVGSTCYDENYSAYITDKGVSIFQAEGETKLIAEYKVCVKWLEWRLGVQGIPPNDEKKTDIEEALISFYNAIGIDKPTNHDEILDFVYDDVCETADPIDWNNGDVATGFRRWIESREED